MWQIALTLLIIAAVLLYLLRHYFRAYRSGEAGCSSCVTCMEAHKDACPESGAGVCECAMPPQDRTCDAERPDPS